MRNQKLAKRENCWNRQRGTKVTTLYLQTTNEGGGRSKLIGQVHKGVSLRGSKENAQMGLKGHLVLCTSLSQKLESEAGEKDELGQETEGKKMHGRKNARQKKWT